MEAAAETGRAEGPRIGSLDRIVDRRVSTHFLSEMNPWLERELCLSNAGVYTYLSNECVVRFQHPLDEELVVMCVQKVKAALHFVCSRGIALVSLSPPNEMAAQSLG